MTIKKGLFTSFLKFIDIFGFAVYNKFDTSGVVLVDKLRERLFSMQDLKYKKFHSKLMPTVNENKIIGVRIPDLRKFAKETDINDVENFMKSLPHKYYEEDNFHGFMIEKINDFDTCIKELEFFLPYIDNWATCDLVTPKVFKKYPDKLILRIEKWLSSSHTYTVRYAIRMLMNFYLDENFCDVYMEMVSEIKSDEYYVKMMIAWYFATALFKKYDKAVLYLKNNKLDVWVHNKTIQKACESYRIEEEIKEYLKTLKR